MIPLLGPSILSSLGSLLTATLSLVPVPPTTPPSDFRAEPAAPSSVAVRRLPAEAAPGVARDRSTAATPWAPPLDGLLVVTEPFAPPEASWLAGHRGVDLDARPGDDVLAAGAGIVVWAAPIAGRGVVSVLHEDGRRTTYEPVDPSVSPGDVVDRAERVGTLGTGSGHCGGSPSCLHWGLRRDEAYLDPLTLLRPGRPVLLPLGP